MSISINKQQKQNKKGSYTNTFNCLEITRATQRSLDITKQELEHLYPFASLPSLILTLSRPRMWQVRPLERDNKKRILSVGYEGWTITESES